MCLAPLPAAWKGPVAFLEDGQTECRGAFPTFVLAGESDLLGADAVCACACDDPAGQTCPAPTLHQHNTDDCTPPNAGSMPMLTCSSVISPPPTAESMSIDADIPTGGSCAAVPTVDVPVMSSKARMLCASVELESCGEGLCAAPPGAGYDRRLCIYAAGDVECPTAQGWVEKVVVFESVEDDRACEPCTCGDPEGGACEGMSAVYSLNMCQNLKAEIPHDGSCVDLGSAGYGSIDLDTPQVVGGQCAPGAVAPIGAVTGLQPTTVCCTPEL